MDSLFGIPLTSILVALLLALGAIFAILGVIAWRQPLLVRMGLRNIARRRAQTTLIVIGLMLSTLIISAAFATGDTVGYSITNEVYDSFGEADILVAFDGDISEFGDRFLNDEFLEALSAEFGDDPDIDGITGVLADVLPAVNPERRLAEADASVIGVDPDTVDAFKGLKTLDGELIAGSTLGGFRAYVSEELAEQIDVAAGDRFQVFRGGEPTEFEVIDIVQNTSITETGGGSRGFVTSLDVARDLTGLDGKLTAVAISITGGVRDTLDLNDAVAARVEDFIAANPESEAGLFFTKKEAVELAEVIGSIFVTFFLIFGLFAIASGILLIFMIFVMLAAERRSEMGMARAVGMQRLHLTETFLAEGMAYNVGSAAVGALLGLAVAFVLVLVLAQIFAEALGFGIAFHFNWQGFLIAYSLGVVLTFATVAFSSFRIANLNIVRAIRDLPEPQALRGADRSVGHLLKAVAGALWLVGWIAVLAIAGYLTVFLAVLAIVAVFGDLPVIFSGLFGGAALMAVGALMFFGARTVRRGQFLTMEGWRNWLLWVLWIVAFQLVAVAIWGLQLSRDWARRHRNGGGWAVVMLSLGVILVWLSGWGLGGPFFAWWQGKAFAYTGGFTLAVFALAMLAVYFGLNERLSFTAAGLGLVWYWVLPLPFSLFFDFSSAVGGELDPVDGVIRLLGLPRPGEIEGNIEMFFVSGIAITAAAVLVIILNAEVALAPVRWLGGLLGGIAPAIKTAIAYPVASKFRTGMTLAMFGLVVFSLVVMATLNSNFTQAFLSDDASGGFDVAVDVNPNNRIPDLREALRSAGYEPDAAIAGAGRLVSAYPQVRRSDHPAGDEAYETYHLAGMDGEFLDLQRFPLEHRAIGYSSDEAVWEAIRGDPTLAVVDASRLLPPSDFGDPNLPGDFFLGVTDNDLRREPWAPIPLTFRDPSSGETSELRVIGVIKPQVTSVIPSFFAIFTSAATVEEGAAGGEFESYFVVTAEDTDEAAIETARAIESTLLELGVQANSIDKLIDDEAATSRSFQYLFEGFMGLGLIVGIAALGVIAFRTVVERRQQIGMLRAIGYSRRLVALSYFLESSFIALAGIAIGLTLGLAISYNLLASPEFTGGVEIDFQVPWARLAVVLCVAYGASALMTLLPARAASRVAVAEALRYA